jgi:hypothetical protein
MLINNTKNGSVDVQSKENFDKIVPSEEAVSYMRRFVNDFMEKEPV